VALIFAVKTFAASLLALYIAFWAGLDDPRWTILTVFVVSQPDSGLVLAKGFYRILGTIAGVLVSIALVFGLAQYGELFVAALAVWICFCNFAARAARNFASYGFQLAGYTVAVVGIPAALVPTGAYPLMVARCSEILLGIVCAALVSRLVLVRELSPRLVVLVRALARRAESFAAVLLDPDPDRERVAAERAELIAAYLEVQGVHHSAYFESAEARIRDQSLRALTQAAVELCITAAIVANHRENSLRRPEDTTCIALPRTNKYRTGGDAIASALVDAADERDVGLARDRLRAFIAAFDRGEKLPEPNYACRLWSDPVPAAIIGVRSAIAIGVTSAFWFATAWPSGPAAVVVAAVVCSLLASLERPDKISLAAGVTVLVAAVLVFATQFYLMPLAVDFASMAVALAPLMLTCGFIMAQPRIGSLGLLSAVYFAFASNIDNVMTYDAVAFLNSLLAIVIGIAIAVVLFATFFPETPAHASRRFRRQLLVHLGRLAARPHGLAFRCYQTALFEQLGTALEYVKDEPKIADKCLTSALAALSAAQAIERMKSALDGAVVAPRIAAEGARLLARLSKTLGNPSVWKFISRIGEARVLGGQALAAAIGSAEPAEIEALAGIVVGCATLGSDLMHLNGIIGKVECNPNLTS
jgi:uncharacterized membrane protein YccC